MAIMAILAITATMAILAITFRNVGADKLLKAHNPSHGLFGLHTKFQSYLATPSCFLWISLQILVIFDQKNIWHTLLGVVYHVKKVSTIFDENWSQNINLKKKKFHSLKSDMKTHCAVHYTLSVLPEWPAKSIQKFSPHNIPPVHVGG